jgi:hypothetical protein
LALIASRKFDGTCDGSRALRIHACLVFDEAGSTGTMGFFESRDSVEGLLAALSGAKIAESFGVVVSGTGLVARQFDSATEAHVFRMKPWRQDGLEALLHHSFSLPLLEALATNGRSAYFLVKAIIEESRETLQLENLSWLAHLRSLLPSVVDHVVCSYVNSNGIRALGASRRRRVAAWVLGTLSKLKKDSLALPKFDGLDMEEQAKAALLIQLNIQQVGEKVCLVPGEPFAATVTPATTIVLFSMAGVLAGVLAGWRGHQEVAALYAARQAMLKCWKEHADALRRLQSKLVRGRDKMTLAEFERELGQVEDERQRRYRGKLRTLTELFDASLNAIRVHRLERMLHSPAEARIFVPMVGKHSIMVSAATASFADVIAHKTFLRAKHTAEPSVAVRIKLADEMGKCCLLKDCQDDRALRGLLALWGGALPPEAIEAASRDRRCRRRGRRRRRRRPWDQRGQQVTRRAPRPFRKT